MFTKLRARLGRPSPATVIALVALFVALGGTGYAALSLPKNSVGTKQLKNNAVTGAKVKNGSLRARDFKTGLLKAGAKGDPCLSSDPNCRGSKGDQGPPGPEVGRVAMASNENFSGGFPFAALVTVSITAPDNGFVRL